MPAGTSTGPNAAVFEVRYDVSSGKTQPGRSGVTGSMMSGACTHT